MASHGTMGLVSPSPYYCYYYDDDKNNNNSGKAMTLMMTTTTNKKQKITNHFVCLKLLEKPLRILVTDILHEHEVVQLLYEPRLCQDGSVLCHWIITIHPPLLLPHPLLMHHQKKRHDSLSVLWENQCVFAMDTCTRRNTFMNNWGFLCC